MKTIQEQQLDFLNDTVNHYNLKNRCASPCGGCYYSPTKVDNNTEGCAIGRHIPAELQLKLDKLDDPIINSEDGKAFSLLPTELQILGKSFLGEIQRLHDDVDNWGKNGISENGLLTVNHIKGIFELEEVAV